MIKRFKALRYDSIRAGKYYAVILLLIQSLSSSPPRGRSGDFSEPLPKKEEEKNQRRTMRTTQLPTNNPRRILKGQKDRS